MTDSRYRHEIRRLLTAFILIIIGVGTAFADNTLRLTNFEALAGGETNVAVYMDNTSSVVGVQFDITLPYARSNSAPQLSATRADGHTVSLRKLSNTKYTVVIMSFANKALKGSEGVLVNIPVDIPSDAQIGTQKIMKLENIVLSDNSGNNVATATSHTATFTVQSTDVPDLVPTGLTFGGSGTTLTPGGKLPVRFTVQNQGTAQTGDGWTEKIYLEDANETRFYIASHNYTATLGAKEQVVRSYEVDIPQVVKTDGSVKVVVEIVPLSSTLEQIADQANNTTVSTDTRTLEKRLFMSENRILLTEGSSRYITLKRSGSQATAETFTLTEQNPIEGKSLVGLSSSTVTIDQNRESVTFTVSALNDSEVNDPDNLRTYVVASGNSYQETTLTVDVEDNDTYALTLTLDKDSYTEGENITLTVSIENTLSEDLKVNITNTSSGLFYPYVRSITIPAGQTSATATTTVVNDNYPMADAQVTFTATATGYQTSRQTITVIDDDWPTLSLTLNPNVISEADGYGATTAIITRQGSIAENLSVFIWSSDNELYFDSQRNIIPAGQRTIEIPISVKDNSIVDANEQRTHTISVAPCDAQTGSYTNANAVAKTVTATLTVTDNESSADLSLKLQCTQATLLEGGSGATVTITRNSTDGTLTVTLSSDDPRLSYPATVTINDGSQTATFTVSATANETAGDESYANLHATASGYQTGAFVFLISDQSKPDAISEAPVVTTTGSIYSGQTISGTVKVTNQGLGEMAAGMPVAIFISTDQSIRISNYYTSPMQKLTTVNTTGAIAIGGSETVDFSLTLPENLIGVYYLFAWANPEYSEDYNESNNYNGRSNTTTGININAPFSLSTLTTDKTSYTQGETVQISGQMSNTDSGQTMTGRQIEVFVIGSGNTLTDLLTTTLNAEGEFTANHVLGSQTGGNYGIGARVLGSDTKSTTAHITVSGLKIETGYLKLTLTENESYNGSISVSNLSPDTPLTNVSLSFNDLPEGWTVVTEPIASLEGSATGNLNFTITPKTPSSSLKYTRTTYSVTANMGESTTEKQATLDYHCKASACKLATNYANGIKTTFSKTAERTWKLTVSNTGSIETGTISVECPSDQPWLTATTANLASLAPNTETELTISLKGSEGMQVDGTYKSYVKLKPQNGTGIVVNVEATLKSSETGTLKVDVVDAFTLEDENVDGAHVSGATVRLTNSLTKEIVSTGTTGSDGLCIFEDLQEGTYYVYVTADNHYYTEKTITVSPGIENELEVFLPYKAVKVTYTVEETTVVDEYRTVLTMEVVPNIPQAIVTPNLPESWGCGTNTYSIRLTNKGRLTAYNPYLEFPTLDGYTFTVKSSYPETLMPNESYDVTIEYSGPEDKSYGSSIGGIIMHYGYKLRGEMYYGSETYAAQVGCSDLPVIIPGGGLDTYTELPNYGGADVADPRLGSATEDLDETGNVSMPSITYRDYTQTQTSSVTLQFEQRFFLERQAFKGHLTVENLQMNGIEAITLVPNVKRTDGTDASDLFAISQKGLGQWKDEDEWTLASSKTGEAEVLYVPSKETAPTTKTDYLFGGTLTYRDIETGKIITVELVQTKLTVNPSPDLHLTYFIQRDFVGDNPLTEEVESWEPAEFALLIQNKGSGDALDLKIETSDPQIVDNQANLPVKFTKLYTTVDGQEKQYNFNNLELGRIEAGRNVMARWWFYSNVSAHVADYNIQMTKHSNYGVEFDLITVDGVRELTRSVKGNISNNAARRRTGSQSQVNTDTNIFLVNMDADTENLPDHVFDENGNMAGLYNCSGFSTTERKAGNVIELNLKASTTDLEWGYCKEEIVDYAQFPNSNFKNLQIGTVTRQSDNADMTSNCWETVENVTVGDEIHQVRYFHLADVMNADRDEKYTIQLVAKPAAAPVVTSIELDNNDPVAATKAVVTFAEEIDPTTIDAEDVVMTVGGESTNVTISDVTSTSFTVNWNALNYASDCSLTVFTSGITNAEGTAGTTNKSKDWAVCQLGDPNCDNEINVTDAISIISHILNEPLFIFIDQAADLNNDGEINVTDAIIVIDIILGRHNLSRKLQNGTPTEGEFIIVEPE